MIVSFAAEVCRRMRRPHGSLFALLLASLVSTAAFGFQERPRVYALKNVKIVPQPGAEIAEGHVVIRDGLIEAVGADVAIPEDAEVFEAEEEEKWTVYAAFIDAASHGGIKMPEPSGDDKKTSKSETLGHANSLVTPQRSFAAFIDPQDSSIGNLRKLGFGLAHSFAKQGMYRGQSVVYILREGDPRDLLVAPDFASVLAIESSSDFSYPSSKMGAVALARQVLYDVRQRNQWQANYLADPRGVPRPEVQLGDEVLAAALAGEQPMVLWAHSLLDLERLQRFITEFNLQNVMVCVPSEAWLQPSLVTEMGQPVLLSLDFPSKPALSSDVDKSNAELSELQAFLAAPRLPGQLKAAGVRLAFSTAGMDSTGDFWKHVHKSVEAGLDPQDALAALTTTPAALLGVSAAFGTVEVGKVANLLVVEGDLFVEKPKMRYLFVDGIHEKMGSAAKKSAGGDGAGSIAGRWIVSASIPGMGEVDMVWTIVDEGGTYRGHYEASGQRMDFISIGFEAPNFTLKAPTPMGIVDVEGTISGDELSAKADVQSPQGQVQISFSGSRSGSPEGGTL